MTLKIALATRIRSCRQSRTTTTLMAMATKHAFPYESRM